MKFLNTLLILLIFSSTALCSKEPKKPEKAQSVSLFDGKTLKGWQVCDYAGTGEIKVIPKKKLCLLVVVKF